MAAVVRPSVEGPAAGSSDYDGLSPGIKVSEVGLAGLSIEFLVHEPYAFIEAEGRLVQRSVAASVAN